MSLRIEAPCISSKKPMGVIDSKPIYNTSYAGHSPQELRLSDSDYSNERKIALQNNSKNGVHPMTTEELDAERKLDWELVKLFTMNIFSLDFTAFSFPVGFSEPRSFLERTGDLFTFLACTYAEKAYLCQSPSERIANLATGIIAGFHLYLQSKKPWNPILGETYVAEWENGTKIYGEQISHHPPISAFEIIGDHYKCTSTCKFTISSGLSKVEVIQKGTFRLEFSDGDVYEWEFPRIAVLGIIRGERYVNVIGKVKIVNPKHNLEAEIKIAPKNNKSKTPQTVISGTVHSTDSKKNTKNEEMKIEGDYTQSVSLNNNEVWNIQKDFASRPSVKIDENEMLLSDSRFRLDRLYLIRGDMQNAGTAKSTLEEAQRREEKLRTCIKKK